MIKFYLNGVEVFVRTYPQIIETKDETLDTCSIVLEANDIATPYAPYQTLVVKNDETTVNVFKVASDTVSVFSNSPLRYTHTLNLIQNIKSLEQHMIRNNVFAQPANNVRRFYFSRTESLYWDSSYQRHEYNGYPADGDSITFGKKSQYWVDDLVLNRKEKIKNAKMRCRYYEIDSNNRINLKQGNITISGISSAFDGAFTLKRPDEETFQLGIIDKPNNTWIDMPSSGGRTFIEFVNYSAYQKIITLDDVPRIDRERAEENDARAKIFQLEIEVEVYYYNCYDILSDILKQYRKKHEHGIVDDYLFNLPESGELYDLLTTTIPPSMTFTQCSIFDAVSEIFKLFDAIFTLDENNNLGIEYYNERNEQETNNENMVGVQKTHSASNYNNGLISYYQNAIQKDVFPRHNFSLLRSSNVGIAQENSFSFIVPHKIDYVDKLTALVKDEIEPHGRIPNFEPSQGSIPVYGNIELDLTPFLYEQSVYALLDESLDTSNYYLKTRQNCIFYNKNSNEIPVFSPTYSTWWGSTINVIEKAYNSAWHRFFGFRTNQQDSGNNNIIGPTYGNDPSKYFLRLEYFCNVNGRARTESLENKYKGEMITNQGQGQIDLNKLGLNLIGLSLKLGQPTLSFTHEISNYNDRIKKGQIYTDENGDVWVANVCTYTILDGNKMRGNIEFTKNFNALSLNVRVDQEKRLTNISNEAAVKCEDDFIEYIYISQNESDRNQRQLINFDVDLEKTVADTLLPRNLVKPINTASFSAKYDDGTAITFSNKNLPARNIYIPIITYGFGNAVCFEVSFDSPISAGKQTSKSPTWYADKYYTIEYLYTDDNGWADLVDLSFFHIDTSFSQEFPYIYPEMQTYDIIEYSNITNLEFLKKPNEIFALNYEIVFLPMPDKINVDFIGSAFINNNALIKINKEAKSYLYYETTDDYKYSVLDTKGHLGNVIEVNDISWGIYDVVIETNLTEKPKAWAICNEEGDILFASNECIEFNNGNITLYLITRQKRL